MNFELSGRQNVTNTSVLLGFGADYARRKMGEIQAFAEEVIRIIDSERLGVEAIHMLSGVGDTTVFVAQSC